MGDTVYTSYTYNNRTMKSYHRAAVAGDACKKKKKIKLSSNNSDFNFKSMGIEI